MRAPPSSTHTVVRNRAMTARSPTFKLPRETSCRNTADVSLTVKTWRWTDLAWAARRTDIVDLARIPTASDFSVAPSDY